MSTQSRKPLGALVIAWILIVIGSLGILGSIVSFLGGNLPWTITFIGIFADAVTIILGIALFRLKRWVLIVALAYLGCVVLLGLLSGLGGFLEGWVGTVIAAPFLLYLWRVREAFGTSAPFDDGASLSIISQQK
jgi:hypothetical protein